MTQPLRRLQHRTVRDFLAVGTGNYGAIALSLAISVVLTRRLGAETFGRLALLLMASQVLSFFAANWTHIGCVRFGAREFASSRTVAATVWTRAWLMLPWAVTAGVALAVWRTPLAAYLGIAPWGLAVIFSHFLAAYAVALLGAVFQSRDQMRYYGVTLFLEKAVMLAAVALSPMAWIRNPLGVLVAYAVSDGLIVTVGWSVAGWQSLWPPTVDRRLLGEMWRFSLPLIISVWTGWLGTCWLDYVMIKWYLPLKELGWYALASQLGGAAQQVTIIFSTLLLPQASVMVANRDTEGIRRFLTRLLPFWLLGAAAFFSLALLVIHPVVPLAFGAGFNGAVPPLALLMIASSGLALYNGLTPLMCAYGATWILAGICVFSAAANVCLNRWWIPAYGINGAAAATVVAYWLSAGLVFGWVQRRVRCSLLPLLACSVPVAAVYLTLRWWPGPAGYVVATVVGVATVWGVARRYDMGLQALAVQWDGLPSWQRRPAGFTGVPWTEEDVTVQEGASHG